MAVLLDTVRFWKVCFPQAGKHPEAKSQGVYVCAHAPVEEQAWHRGAELLIPCRPGDGSQSCRVGTCPCTAVRGQMCGARRGDTKRRGTSSPGHSPSVKGKRMREALACRVHSASPDTLQPLPRLLTVARLAPST